MLPSPHVDSSAAPLSNTSGARWLNDLLACIEQLANRCHTRYHTRVLPCVIQGQQALVHERGLARRQPAMHAYLLHFCTDNHVRLVEDRRGEEVPVPRERRRNLASVVALAASLLAPAAAVAGGDAAALAASADATPPASSVVAAGQDLGDVASVLRISAETRRSGTATRIVTTGQPAADNTLNSAVTRYDHDVSFSGGTQRFSYFEGTDLRALGHVRDEEVDMDVLVGGGPFEAPRLWGPFEKVRHDTVDVHLLVGSDEQEGFGLMKASYRIGVAAEPDAGKGADDAQSANHAVPAGSTDGKSPRADYETPAITSSSDGEERNERQIDAALQGRAAGIGMRAALQHRHRLRHRG